MQTKPLLCLLLFKAIRVCVRLVVFTSIFSHYLAVFVLSQVLSGCEGRRLMRATDEHESQKTTVFPEHIIMMLMDFFY